MSEKKSKQNVNSTTNAIIIGLSVVLVVFIILFVNERAKGGSTSGSTEIVTPLADETVILKYNGGDVRAKEIKGNIDSRVKQLSEEVIEMYKRGAENALVEKLLNAEVQKKGVPNVNALLESIGTASEVSDAEVNAFIKENNLEKGFKDPMTGKMRKVSKDEIKAHLSNRAKVNQRQDYIESLMAGANVEWLLKEPRSQVPAFTADEPLKGNPNAKVVVYEHSDFQCPYCARGKSVVTEIAAAYGDKVAIVFRHLPLDFHPEAKPAAIASVCAQQQGKFWEYHDKLFDNQKQLGAANYPKWAKELGLDEAKFNECLKNPATVQAVEKSQALSEQAGANSTPTFFVGSKTEGKKIAGAQPLQEFKSYRRATEIVSRNLK
ncbi:MAG: thioredoxin domain-containing protein [Bdellovibrionota bacterium]